MQFGHVFAKLPRPGDGEVTRR